MKAASRNYPFLWILIAILSAAGASAASAAGKPKLARGLLAPAASNAAALTPPRAAAGSEDVAAGLETLEEPEERSLPEVSEFGVFIPGRLAIREPSLEHAPGVESRLGPDWRLERQPAGSVKLVLKGPGSRLSAGVSAESVRSLLKELPELFGDAGTQGRLEVVFDRSRAPSGTVRFRQIFDGVRVFGADVSAHFDPQGLLRSISSAYKTDLLPSNTRSIPAEEASAIARRALEAAEPGVGIVAEANAEAWLWPVNGVYRHVWLVRHATRHPLGSFVTRVDAGTGEILARENHVQRAARQGVGSVFKRNANYPDHTSIVKLPGLFGADVNPTGSLYGQRFTILDSLDNPVASPNLKFVYHPFSDLEADSFDQVSAYYHLERAHSRFARALHVSGLPYFDGPTVGVVVNDRDVFPCDAIYASPLFADGSPGIMFADQNSCPFPNLDFTRDSDIIYHEYTHAVIDWAGTGLGSGPVNSYQGAINEAVADYHAANFSADPEIGEVFGYSRSLDNTYLYPDDVGCDNGQIEDHCTGQIWGGFLWDYQKVVKKKAEMLEFSSLDYLQDNWPVGHVAGVIDFLDATLGLLDADYTLNNSRAAGLIYGAAASRGIFSPIPYGSDQPSLIYFGFAGRGKLKSVGWVHVPNKDVPYFFGAPAGSTVSIRVRSAGAFSPSFFLGSIGSAFNLISYQATQTPTLATLTTVLPPTDGIYVLDVFGADEITTGGFQVLIAIK